MMAWLKSPNLYAVAAILGLAVFIYTAGQRHERRKAETEIAAVNVPLAKLQGKDEAEIAAEAAASAKVDAVVSGAISQSCILTDQTAALLASVR